MTYADLIPLSGPRPDDAPRRRRSAEGFRYAAHPTRRGFLAGVLAAGVGAGVAALGVFPRARPAIADPSGQYGYRIFPNGCPPYAGDAECEPGCGPSQVLADTCEPSGDYRGWFKNRPAEGYRLRPGACWAGYDGWRWGHSGTCGNCSQHIEYRCHDGYKLIGGGWYPKICRKVLDCDGRDPDLPVRHDPFGEVTAVDLVAPKTVRVRGWAIDPDADQAAVTVRVHDGARITSTTADRPSLEIPAFFQSSGPNHGFDVTLTNVRPGKHDFRVYARSIGPGITVKLGHRVVRVPSPANTGTG